MLAAEVLAYYERLGERDRLSGGARGRLEFLRTWDLLRRVLPGAPARLLDVGGATGVYAGPLAAAGYPVQLVDPVASHVAIAESLPGVSAALGDARSLEFADGSFDAVLMLGPLYHLVSRDDRISAWREAFRVVRPGGVVAAATIARLASTFDGFVRGSFRLPGYRELTAETRATGVHSPPLDSPYGSGWFTTAYFHHPSEARSEALEVGFSVELVASIEGPAWMIGRLDDFMADDVEREILLDVLRQTEADPTLLGAASHVLTVARRPADDTVDATYQ